MSKRITQTNEIQSGDNSGIVFSGDEKASYSQDFTLEEFEGRDLITLDAANELISGNDPIPTISVWEEGETAMLDDYRTHQIGDIEYLFRSLEPDNTSEPSLDGGQPAWENSGENGFPNQYLEVTTYPAGRIVWEYDPDFPGDITKLTAFRSLQNANFDNPLDFNGDTLWWEKLGLYVSPYVYVPGETYELRQVVVDDTDGDKIYISNVADNNYALDESLPGTSSWQVIGAPAGGGSPGSPTTGTLESSDAPLVITWDTDLVPDDEEGRTYLEKHGPLEKVSIQVTMPDPANDGDNTFLPSWRFDEATKNILTIDNQGQKLYYVIGFGADGSSGGGGSMTGAEIRSALGITTLSGSNTGDQDLSGLATTSALTAGLSGKQNTIALTTTGTSGAATFDGTTLNVPNYATGGGGVSLGETSTTAYRGDRGKVAYDHSQLVSGNPHDVNKADVGLGSVDNTSDAAKPVSTATQTALDGKIDLTNVQTITAPKKTTFSWSFANRNILTSVDTTDMVVQKYNQRFTFINDNSVATPVSLGTSLLTTGRIYEFPDAPGTLALASQLPDVSGLAPLASPTFTGTVGGITKSMVGLGSVDNTADSAKPVSTAQQTALDLKAPLASPAFTGTPSLPTGTTGVTQTAGDSSTKLATTAFVTTADNLKAPLASPALTGTPTAPTASVGTNTTQLATMAALYSAVTQLQGIDTQTASYTLVLADAGKLVQMNVASANNLTIPLNSSVAFPVNTQLVIRQIGAGQTTVVATGGVTIQSSGSKLKLTGQYSGATLIKIATDTWALMGDLSS